MRVRKTKAEEGRGYIEARTDTTQQTGQTPNKKIDINHITLFVSGYAETDPTGMLSPNHGRPSGSNKVGQFLADRFSIHLLQFAQDSCVVTMDKAYKTELVRYMGPLWDQRDKNYHNRNLRPKLWDEIEEKLNVADKY